MKNFMSKLMLSAALVAGLTGAAGAATKDDGDHSDPALAKKVAHEVRMYSWYSIWDNINVKVNDGNVELLGQVSQPYKKADLQRLAQTVPGVRSVTNELEVLPLSNFDDQLRRQVARAIYRDPVLSRYAIQAIPPIHIIVDNGHVTLEGVVNNEMEKNVAGIRANAAGLSFGKVVNNLRVENPSHKS
jgi:hyperosmotically inducible protein